MTRREQMQDYLGYKNKICVVTGASSGMGRETARILANLGAIVYTISRRSCDVEGITQSIQADLSCREDIDTAFRQLPERIDCFFGVAGLSGNRSDYMTTFNVNYTANRYISECYLKQRIPEGGAIVFVTSTSGVAWQENYEECCKILDAVSWEEIQERMAALVKPGTPPQVAYMLSKRLMNAYACHLAVELGEKKVRVNAVLPGSTDTGMKDEFAEMAGGLENMIRFAGKAGRLASSEEVAMPIVFLGSDMAKFISGEELIVDFCDNAMKKTGLKPEICGAPAL